MFTVLCRHAHSDWQSTEAFSMLLESLILWKYIIVLNIKGKNNFNLFHYKTVVEIPTQKGEHSWKCTELSLKRIDW